jgi:hypothetical protein
MAMRWSLSNALANALMSVRILYGILLACSLAMLLFVVGFVLFHLGLSLLTTLFYVLAGKIMLVAFALLALWGLVVLLRALWRDLRDYFRKDAVAVRRLWSVKSQQLYLEQQGFLESQQIQNRSRFKRLRLLDANNKKHLRALYDGIYAELQAVKSNLSEDRYQDLLQALQRYHKQADAEAMLALRKQLP